jgi:acyl-CoA reductase-like NAD-dependent aldehyde dehydrogenase
VAERFVEVVAAEAPKYRAADPLDAATEMGALVDEGQLRTVMGYIDAGKAEGARAVTGGVRARESSGGYYVEPTVFDRVDNGMTIAREEIFGPVLAAIDFMDVDEAIARANDTVYGLAAGVWTRDIKKAHYVASKLQAGLVWVNTYNVYDTAAPFGGYKQSGFGREMSKYAFDSYTQIKTVWVDLN